MLEDRDIVVSKRSDGQRTTPLAAGAVHEYYRAIDPDLVPLKTPNPPDRNDRTAAELLFGVVEERAS